MYRTIAALVVAVSAVAVPVFAQDAGQGAEQKQEQPKKAVEPIDFRKLKEHLPESVGGIKRSNAEGAKNSFGEAKVSQAEGDYQPEEGEAHARIEIIDYGGIPGMAEGMAYWLKVEIDNESDDEYSKTVKYGNHRGLETYNTKDKHGTLQLVVADRLIITITLDHIEPTEFAKTVEAMKLDALAELAK